MKCTTKYYATLCENLQKSKHIKVRGGGLKQHIIEVNLRIIYCFIIALLYNIIKLVREVSYLDLMIWTAIVIVIICFFFWVVIKLSVNEEQGVVLRARRSIQHTDTHDHQPGMVF